MPNPPAGEHALRELADRFAETAGYIIGMIGEAAAGNRTQATSRVLHVLNALRLLNLGSPVHTAYYVARYTTGEKGGDVSAVDDLARSLAFKLNSAARVCSDSVRSAFKTVTIPTLEEHSVAALVSHVDRSGRQWPLDAYANMACTTIGRQATSRGITAREGEGGVVTIEVGECKYCAGFKGEAKVGTDPLPPYHPNCTCTVSTS